MGAILGGGSGEARKQAELSRRTQEVANERQLAALNRQDQEATTPRRNPRGRRLFTEKTTLA